MMKYRSIDELPFVCQYNLPEAALHVYKNAFNAAIEDELDEHTAHMQAFDAVHQRFRKDELTGRWVARRTTNAARSHNEPATSERVSP